MAFDRNFIDPGPNSKGLMHRAVYTTTVDARAVVEGAGYFNPVATELSVLNASGTILVRATDATVEYGYTVAAAVVTLDTVNANLLD